MDGGKGKMPWYFCVAAALVLGIHALKDQLKNTDLVLIMVGLVFMLAFCGLLVHAIREWKKTDEEIVSGYRKLAAFFSGSSAFSPAHRSQQLLSAATLVVIFLHSSRKLPGAVSRYVLCGISLLLVGIPLLRSLRPKEAEASRKRSSIPAEAVTAIVLGLIPTAFMCFFCGLGTYHGAWWFVLPPGSVFLMLFSRPLVAGIRVLLKDHSKKEQDPWDRKDQIS